MVSMRGERQAALPSERPVATRRAFNSGRIAHIEFEGVFGRACMASFPFPREDWVRGLGLCRSSSAPRRGPA
jgi:hypothetical protein